MKADSPRVCPGIAARKDGRAVEVRGNAIREAGFAGIALLGASGCRIVENVVRFAATDGLVVDAASSDNTLAGNQATENTSHGIEVGGSRNLLRDNVLGGNTDWGIYLTANATDNVYRGNVARGNTATGACAGGTTDFCDRGTGNTSNGDNFLPSLR